MYDWLALLPFDQNRDGDIEGCINAALQKRDGLQSVYVITGEVDEPLRKAVTTALASGCRVACVLVDSAEEVSGAGIMLPAGAGEIKIKSGQDVAEVLGGAL